MLGLVVTMRWWVGLVLIAAGAMKLRGVRRFARQLAKFDAIPRAAAPMVAAVLPVVEVAVGVGMCVGVGGAGPAAAAAWLMAAFAVVLGVNVVNGHTRVSCGCFGAGGDRIGWAHVATNAALGAMAAAVALHAGDEPATREALGPAASLGFALVGVYAALLLGAAYQRAEVADQVRRRLVALPDRSFRVDENEP